MSAKNLNVVVWNEFRHERMEEACRAIYPDGIHGLIKSFLEADDATLNVRLAALDDPDQGLPDEVLNETDVLLWWGHMAHHEVDDGLWSASVSGFTWARWVSSSSTRVTTPRSSSRW